jgi:chromosome segregation ATPase
MFWKPLSTGGAQTSFIERLPPPGGKYPQRDPTMDEMMKKMDTPKEEAMETKPAKKAGKKMTSITLMSGGEKAMTAVSLIFSIFLVKPSPFCLLDEVDAPLDDANVGRFNELLREMSSESQFILITHNKKTMELNDTLYGVTMQEPGVSKAVSVQLH